MTEIRAVLGLFADLVTGIPTLWSRRQQRKRCWHHDPKTGESWQRSRLINTGTGKMFWCTKCSKTEFV